MHACMHICLYFLCITVQSQMREKELYTQFFAKLIDSLCDDQTHSSLVGQLASLSLISATDKETQLSSAQDPRQRAISLLLLLDTENEPRHIIELIRAMKDIDEMQALANEMSVQYKAMSVQCDGPTDSEEYTYTTRLWKVYKLAYGL